MEFQRRTLILRSFLCQGQVFISNLKFSVWYNNKEAADQNSTAVGTTATILQIVLPVVAITIGILNVALLVVAYQKNGKHVMAGNTPQTGKDT